MVEAEEEEEVGQPTATTPRCSNTTRSTLPTSTPLTGLVPPRGTALATAAAEAAAEAEAVRATTRKAEGIATILGGKKEGRTGGWWSGTSRTASAASPSASARSYRRPRTRSNDGISP